MANASNIEILNQIVSTDTIVLNTEIVSRIVSHAGEKAILAQIRLLAESGVKYTLLPKVSGATQHGVFLLEGKCVCALTFQHKQN